MRPGPDLQRAVRLSGFAACLATVLFLAAAASYLQRADARPQLWDRTWAAGEVITFDDRPEVILWGQDLAGPAQDVTCTLTGARTYDGVLPAGPDDSRAALSTITVDGHDLTYLARVDHIRRGTVVCEGGVLTQVRVSDDVRPGLERGCAIAFLVAAGVAALWALTSLSAKRRPR